MTKTQNLAERFLETVKTKKTLSELEYEQINNVPNDLTQKIQSWKDEGLDHSTLNDVGFAYFLKSLAETHSIEDIKALVEVAYDAQQPYGICSYDEYGQVTDDLFDCLDKWKNADISRLFALETVLDITAIELGEVLSEKGAKKLMLDYVINRYSGI